MSTTTTVTMAEAAVELQTLPPATSIRSAVLPPPRDNDNSEENTPSGLQSGLEQASRHFSVEPIVTIDRTKRFIITSLLVTANVIQFISNFATMAGGLALSASFGRDVGAGQANWMAAAYPLTQGAFVLITGRLGTVYGHQRMALAGCLLFSIFTFANAFCKTYDSFIALRALTGVGGGMFMPNAVAIITTVVPPGRSRNVTLGFFAISPPIGSVIGGLLAGLFIESLHWSWLFVLMAGMSILTTIGLAILFPRDHPLDRGGKIDYFGAFLGLGSLLLFNFVWNQAPAVGWDTPYEIACLAVSVIMFVSFIIWEKKYASAPIMPVNIFRAPSFTALIFVVLLTYMGFGISLWYTISWQQTLRSTSVLQTGIQFMPFGFGSIASVAIAAWLIPRVAAQYIMAIGIATVIMSNLILALMPIQQGYWQQIFPATMIASFCPDFVYIAAQLIASNSVGRRHQGVAGSLIGTLNLYGNSLGLGFAGTIESQVAGGHTVKELAFGYRAALYFGMAVAVVGLGLDFVFVRMPKDSREGWDETLETEQDVTVQASATAIDRPTTA